MSSDTASLLAGDRWRQQWAPVAAAPAVAVSPVAPVAPRPSPAAHGAATWVDPRTWTSQERPRLRQALGARYDAFARLVTRTLAEEPGLRAAGAADELLTALVALCAYHHEPAPINAVLRGGPGDAERSRVIARGAAYGLRRLPTVIGPVFACASGPARYQEGDVLVEPAFVDVSLRAGRPPGPAVEYLIWSASARRVDRFAARFSATFPPGSRFAVVAVDGSRVLLCDQVAGDTRVVDRLRDAVLDEPSAGPPLAFVLGLDHAGRGFTPPEPAR
jgi:hypothetical protein